MPKQQTRRRPAIQADREYIEREEHRLCHGEGCRNVVAVWTMKVLCSRCRSSEENR